MLPERKIIRADFHDYSGGIYFVTICTQEKEHFFGEISHGRMHYTPIGQYAHDALHRLASHYSYAEVPLFTVMPNHIHAIITIGDNSATREDIPAFRTALGVVVGGYKQSVTCFARRNGITFAWQSRYHDHIIRNNRDGNMISEYIENNVARWDNDCFNNGK